MNYITKNLIAGIAYFIGAYVGLLIALPPSNASPIWPPAGIALAILLIFGYKALPGLIIGAFAAQLYSFIDTSSTEAIIQSMVIGFIIGCGSIIQAGTGKFLIDRLVGENDYLLEDNKILKFMFLGGPVSCAVSSTIGTSAITIANIITSKEYLLTWLTWWVGDSIGVLVLTPMILILFAHPRHIWHSRIKSVFYPLCIFLIMIMMLFYYGKAQDVKRISSEYDQLVSEIHTLLQDRINRHLDGIDGLEALFSSTKKIVSEDEFMDYTNLHLQQFASIQTLEWIPRVKHQDRADFESDFLGTDSIRETDEQNNMITAEIRDEYFPIRYLNPHAGNERALGFDISTNPEAYMTLQKARDTGKPAMTAPIQLVQDRGRQIGTVIYTPIYNSFTIPSSIEERKDQFLGVIACVFRISDSVRSVFKLKNEYPINLIINESNILLVERNLDEARHDLDLIDLSRKLKVRVADKEWLFTYTPSLAYFKIHLYWHTWWLILIGMIITAMAGAGLLMLTGRTLQTEQLVKKRTNELEEEINERKNAENLVNEMNLALSNAMPGISRLDVSGCYTYVNNEYARLLGYTRDELEGKSWELTIHPDDLAIAHTAYETMRKEGKSEFEARAIRKDGDIFHKMVLLVKIVDDEGKFTGHHCFMRDISKRKQVENLLTFQATHDALTGLVNRSEFERRIERLLSTIEKNGGEHALCYMDLDQFKIVNDTCGHIGGDELLRQLSVLLQNTVRKRDTLARLGGDEFGVLIEHCTIENAHRVATSLLNAVRDFQFIWEEHTFKVGISIGLVAIKEGINNITDVLKQADIACYTAKEKGRNRIHVYDEGDIDTYEYQGKLQWVTRINKALEEDRFCLLAQVITPLDSEKNSNYELLIRMMGEGGDHILPGAFMPSAERYNLIQKIDRWVIKKTLNLLDDQEQFLDSIDFISINLSGQSLVEDDFHDFVMMRMKEKKRIAEKICFEITETSAISNMNQAIKFINLLKKYGCRFALDDFGSGLSSYAYLKNLPVNYLKIDGLFVKDIINDPIDFAMVKSIHEIGKVMEMQTIAEYVENNKTREKLEEIGVNYMQGFGIGLPLLLDELLNI